jgi:hypothetical protein
MATTRFSFDSIACSGVKRGTLVEALAAVVAGVNGTVVDGPAVPGAAGEGLRIVGEAVVVVVVRVGATATADVVVVLRGMVEVVVGATMVVVVVAGGLVVVVGAVVVVGGIVVVGRAVVVGARVVVDEVVLAVVIDDVVDVVVDVVPLPPATETATLSMLMWPSSMPPNSSNFMALVVPANAVRS